MPKVSIIIPVYNSESYLEKCLDSVCQQTLSDIEVIIINDGSTDHSQDIINDYAVRYPDMIRLLSLENGGQGRARNRGIEMSQGEYIAFVDSDDYIALDMFEKLYQAAIKKNAQVVFCDYYYGNTKDGFDIVKPKIPINQRDMFIDPDVSPCNKLYLGSMIRDHKDIRFPEHLFYEDTAFYFMYIPYVKKISYVHTAFYYYIIHGDSSVHGVQDKKVNHIFPVMNSMVNYYHINNFYDKYKYEIEYAYSKILLCSSLGRICQVEDRNIRNKAAFTTLNMLKKYFPNYKNNPYLHGIKGMCMRYISKYNIKLLLSIMKILNLHQR